MIRKSADNFENWRRNPRSNLIGSLAIFSAGEPIRQQQHQQEEEEEQKGQEEEEEEGQEVEDEEDQRRM